MSKTTKVSLLAIAGIFAGLLFSPSNASALGGTSDLLPRPFWELPQINYNLGDSEINLSNNATYPYWGHDGKGLVFANTTDYLKDENGQVSPQIRTAEYDDRIDYSLKFTVKKYIDDDTTKPALSYRFNVAMRGALRPDLSTIQMKLNGEDCPSNICSNNSELSSLSGSVTYAQGYSNTPTQLISGDEAEIEITFSGVFRGNIAADNTADATIEYSYRDTAANTGAYVEDLAPVTATVRMGSILIHKTDPQGNPIAGAKFTVSDTKATLIGGRYRYSPEFGERTEYTTDEYGVALIVGLPFGSYTVKEVAAPAGYIADDREHVVTVDEQSSSLNAYQKDNYEAITKVSGQWSEDFYYPTTNPTDYIHELPNGVTYFDSGEASKHGSMPAGWPDVTIWGYVDDVSQYSVGQNFQGTGPGWVSLFGFVQENDHGGYTFNMQNGSEVVSCDMESDSANGYYCYLAYPGSAEQFAITEQSDGSISVFSPPLFQNENAVTFTYDAGSGYYKSADFGDDIYIKKNNGEYLVYPFGNDEIFLTFKRNEATGKYVYEAVLEAARIEKLADGSLLGSVGSEFWYDEAQDYYVWGSGYLVQAAAKKTTVTDQVFSTELTVVNRPTDDADGSSEETPEPEEVTNPQTTDGVLVAMATLAVAGVVAGRLRRAARLRR